MKCTLPRCHSLKRMSTAILGRRGRSRNCSKFAVKTSLFCFSSEQRAPVCQCTRPARSPPAHVSLERCSRTANSLHASSACRTRCSTQCESSYRQVGIVLVTLVGCLYLFRLLSRVRANNESPLVCEQFNAIARLHRQRRVEKCDNGEQQHTATHEHLSATDEVTGSCNE